MLFEVLQPMITGSTTSVFNQEEIFFYSSSLSASKDLPYSSSFIASDVDSLFTTHTGL